VRACPGRTVALREVDSGPEMWLVVHGVLLDSRVRLDHLEKGELACDLGDQSEQLLDHLVAGRAVLLHRRGRAVLEVVAHEVPGHGVQGLADRRDLVMMSAQ